MTLSPALRTRLVFLVRVTAKEVRHLQQTDERFFGAGFSREAVCSLENDPDRSEKADAFVSRFGRLQDTLGDKLLPLLLRASGEKIGTAIDNLDKAERLGWLRAEAWMQMRDLRNQMIHEYVEDIDILFDALQSGHAFVPALLATAKILTEETIRLRGYEH